MRIAFLHTPTPILLNNITRADMQPEHVSSATDFTPFAGFILLDDLSVSCVQLLRQQAQLGKPILGIGKGAECLTTNGFVPGLENDRPCIALTDTDNSASTIRLTPHYQLNAFTHRLTCKNELPIDPTPRRFSIPPALAMEMQGLGTTVFQFGESIETIAGVANKMGNVLALLPQLQESQQSDLIFQSMRDYIREGYVQQVAPLNYHSRF